MRDQATVTSILQHLAMPGRQDITEHSNFPISKANKQHDFLAINNGPYQQLELHMHNHDQPWWYMERGLASAM